MWLSPSKALLVIYSYFYWPYPVHSLNRKHYLMLFLVTELHKELDDQENVVEFDFLGKDSIRYQNKVPVEKRVCISAFISYYVIEILVLRILRHFLRGFYILLIIIPE